jgi:hypothetical protein
LLAEVLLVASAFSLLIVHPAQAVAANRPKGGGVRIPGDLLADLQDSKTDLLRVIGAVVRGRVPYIFIPSTAVEAWERREPEHWARVTEWLAEQNVALVQV